LNYDRIDGTLLARMFLDGTRKLTDNRDEVNALNVYPVPDGDTGTNMSLTMGSAVADLQKKPLTTCADVSKAVARGSLMGARGNSGVILSQIFRGFSKGCEHKETLTVPEFAAALHEASDMAYRAVLKPVEGTILTVIRETGVYSVQVAEEGMLFHHFFRLVLNHATEALNRTPELLPVLKQAGVVDAGGRGLVLILEGFLHSVVSDDADQPIHLDEPVSIQVVTAAQPHVADITFTYCTEFIVRGSQMDAKALKHAVAPMGDSMVFVADDDLIKVHIHTNEPGVVLQHALKQGELINIKIENMKEQHHSIIQNNGGELATTEKAVVPVVEKPFGILTVSAGDGLVRIFKDLQADVVLEGGQTMNPSTEDILTGIEQIPAECVFVLPNNSNIILAANQAKSLSEKNIVVIPSKSVPQGISAIVHFNPDYSPEENERRMSDALASVKTVQITYSVRDTQFGERDIRKDDYLGILNGDIVSSGPDQSPVVMEALHSAVDESSEILTLYYGDGIEESEAEKMAETIGGVWPELEVEVYPGGQPVYQYLFSIE